MNDDFPDFDENLPALPQRRGKKKKRPKNVQEDTGAGLPWWMIAVGGGLFILLVVSVIGLLVMSLDSSGGIDDDNLANEPASPQDPLPAAQPEVPDLPPLNAERIAWAEKELAGRFLLYVAEDWRIPESPDGKQGKSEQKNSHVSHLPFLEAKVEDGKWMITVGSQEWTGTTAELQNLSFRVKREDLPDDLHALPHFDDAPDLVLTISISRLQTERIAPRWEIKTEGFPRYTELVVNRHAFINGEAEYPRPPKGSVVVEKSTVINGQAVGGHLEVRSPGRAGFQSLNAALNPLRDTRTVEDLNNGERRRLAGQNNPILSMSVSPAGNVLTTDFSGRGQLFSLQSDAPARILGFPRMAEFPGFAEFVSDSQVLVAAGLSTQPSLVLVSIDSPQDIEQTYLLVETPLADAAHISSLQVSSDNKTAVAVVGSHPPVACALDIESGQVRFRKSLYMSTAELSADGQRLLLSGESKRFELVDTTTGNILATVSHEKIDSRFAVSPHGKRVAEATDNGRIRIVETDSGSVQAWLIPTDVRDQAATESLRFSADGSRLISLNQNYVLRTWDTHTGRELRHYQLSHVQGEPTARHWRFRDVVGINERSFRFRSNPSQPLAHIHFAEGENLLTSSPKGTVSVWDANGGETPNASGLSFQLLPRGLEEIANESVQLALQPESATGYALTRPPFISYEAKNPTLAFDGNSGQRIVRLDNPVSVAYEVQDRGGSTISKFQQPQDVVFRDITIAAIHPLEEQYLFTDGNHIWLHRDLEGPPDAISSDTVNSCDALGYSPDGQYVFGIGFDDLTILNSQTLDEVAHIDDVQHVLAFDPNNPHRFAVAYKSSSRNPVFAAGEIRGNKLIPAYPPVDIGTSRNEVAELARGVNGEFLAVIDQFDNMAAYDIFTGKPVLVFRDSSGLRPASNGHQYFSFEPDTINVYDAESRERIRQIPPVDEQGRRVKKHLQLLPGETLVLECKPNRTKDPDNPRSYINSTDMNFYSVETGELSFRAAFVHTGSWSGLPRAVTASPDTKYLAIADEAANVAIIRLADSRVLGTGRLPQGAQQIAFDPDSQKMWIMTERFSNFQYFFSDLSDLLQAE